MGKNKKPGSNDLRQPAAKKIVQQGNNSHLIPILFLIAITAISFYPMLKNNFINWDDDFYVINNALLRGPDWRGIFTEGVSSNYHPLTIITLAFNYAISG